MSYPVQPTAAPPQGIPRPLRLAIIGSRKLEGARAAVSAYVHSLPADTVIVTGGWASLAGGYRVVEATAGVDREAYIAAEQRGLVTVLVVGSTTTKKHMAGVQRNPIIADVADCVTAFWDLRSTGTAGTLHLFLERGKGILVLDEHAQEIPHWRQLMPERRW